MQGKLENRFAIRLVNKASDPEYQQGLRIYNDTTPYDIKTNTNEMSRWLTADLNSSTFELLLFVLYSNSDVIGLAMLSYIPKYQLVIYDYIAIKNEYRINAVLFSYINLIQNYMCQGNYNIAYYVVEISNKNAGKSIDKESRLFKKLICLEGFGQINVKYQTLPLGLEHHESSFEAFLYVKSNDDLTSISKETFLDIVHAIYYEYYLTWYTPFLTPEKLKMFKEESIDRCYNMLKENLSEKIQLKIEYADCPMLGNVMDEKTFGHLPSSQKEHVGRYILTAILVIVGPILLILGYNFVLGKLGIPLSTVSSSIGAIVAALLSSFTLLMSKKKS